jgi:hypothetical protein
LFILYNPGDAGFLWNVGVGKVDIFGTLFALLFLFYLRKIVKDWNYREACFAAMSLMMSLGTKYSFWILLFPFALYFIYFVFKNIGFNRNIIIIFLLLYLCIDVVTLSFNLVTFKIYQVIGYSEVSSAVKVASVIWILNVSSL